MPMTTKLGTVVTYHKELSPIKSHDPLIMWSREIMWQIKIIITPLPERLPPPMAMVTYLDGLLPTKSHHHFIMGSCKITWWTKTIISPLPVPMATKFGRVTYLERLQTIKSYSTWIMLFVLQGHVTKNPIISLLPERLWPPNLAGW